MRFLELGNCRKRNIIKPEFFAMLQFRDIDFLNIKGIVEEVL